MKTSGVYNNGVYLHDSRPSGLPSNLKFKSLTNIHSFVTLMCPSEKTLKSVKVCEVGLFLIKKIGSLFSDRSLILVLIKILIVIIVVSILTAFLIVNMSIAIVFFFSILSLFVLIFFFFFFFCFILFQHAH